MTLNAPGAAHPTDVTRWWGVEHSCGGEERRYPTLHWLGEGPNDPVDVSPPPRRVLVCDICADRVLAPDPDFTDEIVTALRLQRMAAGYFG